MPNYDLSRLGSTEFEHLIQAILKKVIGTGTITFGAGRDGAREATYKGSAPYPSDVHKFKGDWIFQAKYHDLELLGVDKARKQVLSEIDAELDKIVNKYKHPCDNYILATNVPLTGVAGSGNIDLIANDIIPKYGAKIKNVHIWAADDIQRYLEIYADIRTTYLHFIVAGDVLYQLIKKNERDIEEVALTIKEYVKVLYTREQNAQLDQAGDVSDEPVRIQQVFFDLLAKYDFEVNSVGAKVLAKFNNRFGETFQQGRENVWSPLALLASEAIKDLVIIGGPGEGKSTIGQFLAQMHRARLIGKTDELTIAESYTPVVPRIPIRVVLRDFAQWLARPDEDRGSSGRTLDEYIANHIREATARSISTKELHRVIQDNPTLLIFDGLDEVSGEDIRRSLLERLTEFTERCRTTLNSDVQVLAATRPTGYSNQFDPKRYLHLRLIKLVHDQVRDYVVKWVKARTIEPSKAIHLQENIEECLIDPQISLLTNTPLQVTILVLIISAGGSPPRQREALFDEYLNVIYKRETGKGKNVISSEREKLVGLHKYIGYILHEKATSAASAGAVLDRPDYESEVTKYLKSCDPFSGALEIRSVQRAITRDAGERLVLLVEPRPDQFGFELRSIQEFFAACHMADTSISTEIRFRRFDAIARLDHWRNVALYFAGRVGRNYSGETGNIIEVCHNLNRETHSSTVQRGSMLALELAADRAFGHNRRSQRRLLEIGLEVLERSLSRMRLGQIIELLQKLPAEDIRDHVNVLLRRKLELLDSSHIVQFPEVIAACNADKSLQRMAITKIAQSSETRIEALRNIFRLKLDSATTGESVVRDLVGVTSSDELCRLLSSFQGSDILFCIERSIADGVPERVIWQCLSNLVFSRKFDLHLIVSTYRAKLVRLRKESRFTTLPGVFMVCALVSAAIVLFEREMSDVPIVRSRRKSSFHRNMKDLLPKFIVDGELAPAASSELGLVSECLLALPWIAHVLVGRVTRRSAKDFIEFLISHRSHRCVAEYASDMKIIWRPALSVLVDAVYRGDEIDVEEAAEFLSRHGGGWLGFEYSQNLLYKAARIPLSRFEPDLSMCEFDLTEEEAHQFRFRYPCTDLQARLVYVSAIRVANLQGELSPHVSLSVARAATKELKLHGCLSEASWHLLSGFDRRLEELRPDEAYEVALDVTSAIGSTIDLGGEADLRLFLEYMYVIYHKRVPAEVRRNELLVQLSRFKGMSPPSMFSWDGKSTIGAMIRDALLCASRQASEELVAGAQYLVDIIATSSKFWVNTRGGRAANFSFRGFSGLHRDYADRAETDDSIKMSLTLFSLRKLGAKADYDCLDRLLKRASKENISNFFGLISSESLRDADHREFWIELVGSLIPESRLGDDHAALVDAMTVLLAEADQSLSQFEHELGLPLAVEPD